jgi:hypothetical protein
VDCTAAVLMPNYGERVFEASRDFLCVHNNLSDFGS